MHTYMHTYVIPYRTIPYHNIILFYIALHCITLHTYIHLHHHIPPPQGGRDRQRHTWLAADIQTYIHFCPPPPPQTQLRGGLWGGERGAGARRGYIIYTYPMKSHQITIKSPSNPIKSHQITMKSPLNHH